LGILDGGGRGGGQRKGWQLLVQLLLLVKELLEVKAKIE
jgi:hypothetical protein